MAICKLTADLSLERDSAKRTLRGRVEIFKQLIPEAVADGKIDWDTLKELLGNMR